MRTLALIFTFLFLLPSLVWGQNATSEKTPDNRFQNNVKFTSSSLYARGISSFNLDLEWWTLFDQFVYYHNTEWSYSGGDILGKYRRSDLIGEADLLDRFDQVKPSHVKLAFEAELWGFNETRSTPNCLTDRQAVIKFGVILESTPHFPISSAGQTADALTPASPRSWTDIFTIKTGKIPDCKKGAPDADKRIFNTFKSAKRLTTRNPSVAEAKWPETTLKSIFDELERRRKKEKEGEGDTENLWSEESENESSEASGGIWDDEKISKKIPLNQGSEDNYWSETETKEVSKNSLETNFKITKDNNGHEGVISSTGDVLIPFNDWEILAFEGGLATVKQEIRDWRRCRGFVMLVWKTTIVGDVDRSGSWGVETQKEAVVAIGQSSPFSEWDSYDGNNTKSESEDYYVEYCKELRKTQSAKLISEGFSVKEDWIKDINLVDW